MNSENPQIVTVVGGSGFLGRHVVRALAKRGYLVRVACRRPDLAGHTQPMGTVGQIQAVQANVRFPESIEAAVRGADIVVNLVGILFESGSQTFDEVQAEGAGLVADAARRAGSKGFVHVSAIGADAQSPAAYARTKAAGEQAVAKAFPGAVIMRPSIIFGPEDNFFNMFAGIARLSPILPLIGGGGTLFQPVFVGDVAEAIAIAVDGGAKAGLVYELGGPTQKSFKDILSFIADTIGRRRLFLPVPWFAAEIKGRILGMLPKPLLTYDQVLMLKEDNVVSVAAFKQARTLQDLGITARSVEAIVPSYLYRFRAAGQFSEKPHTSAD
jgi:uncharacterized protein YbjT (DUF2867 family)